MKKGKIWIIKVMGIPIGLDVSWFLVFALFTWILAVNYFPVEFKTWTVVQLWAVAAVTTLLFFVSAGAFIGSFTLQASGEEHHDVHIWRGI
jgi:hypothetical protein